MSRFDVMKKGKGCSGFVPTTAITLLERLLSAAGDTRRLLLGRPFITFSFSYQPLSLSLIEFLCKNGSKALYHRSVAGESGSFPSTSTRWPHVATLGSSGSGRTSRKAFIIQISLCPDYAS